MWGRRSRPYKSKVQCIYFYNILSTASNCDQKHLENSEIGLENSWNFFLPKEWEPCLRVHLCEKTWLNLE